CRRLVGITAISEGNVHSAHLILVYPAPRRPQDAAFTTGYRSITTGGNLLHPRLALLDTGTVPRWAGWCWRLAALVQEHATFSSMLSCPPLPPGEGEGEGLCGLTHGAPHPCPLARLCRRGNRVGGMARFRVSGGQLRIRPTQPFPRGEGGEEPYL